MKNRNYLIFGGSFNPVHEGHLRLVEWLLQQNIEKLWVIPAACSPFKKTSEMLPNDLRLEMLFRVFPPSKRLEVSDIELQRTGPSYSWQTLKDLRLHHPKIQWSLVLGSDTYQNFPLWKNAPWILKHANLWIIERASKEKKDLAPWLLTPFLHQHFASIQWDPQQRIVWSDKRPIISYFPIQLPDISASAIRHDPNLHFWIPEAARTLYLNHVQQESIPLKTV